MTIIINNIIDNNIIIPSCIENNITDLTENIAVSSFPKVISSKITSLNTKIISVKWNKEVEASCDVKDKINIIINGNPPIHPTSVTFSATDKSIMNLGVTADFLGGQIITWSYNDSGTCYIHGITSPNDKVIGRINSVYNRLGQAAFSHAFNIGFK